jgi:hypothetical protein
MVPLTRVLPVVGSNVELAAHRVVRGRLRFMVRTGLRIYVPREDYLSLCEAAWARNVRRLGGGRGETAPIVDEHASEARPGRETLKPIHDGRRLDRYHRSPILRWARAFRRWWRS